jgi:predicted nuclease with TOPRIM domain
MPNNDASSNDTPLPSRLEQIIGQVKAIDSKLAPLMERQKAVAAAIRDVKSKQTETYAERASLPITEGSRVRPDLDSLNAELSALEHEESALDSAINRLTSEKNFFSPEFVDLQKAEKDRVEVAQIERLRKLHVEAQVKVENLDQAWGMAMREEQIARSQWSSAVQVRFQRQQDEAWEKQKAKLNQRNAGRAVLPAGA